MRRNRFVYASLLALTIAAGLGSRRFAHLLPPILQTNSGDALWALALFFMLGLIFHRAATDKLAAAALIMAALDEVSQLYHAPWIDAIRDTHMGALLLGWGFLWSDLVCYAVGVGFGAAAEKVILARQLLPVTGRGESNALEEKLHDRTP